MPATLDPPPSVTGPLPPDDLRDDPSDDPPPLSTGNPPPGDNGSDNGFGGGDDEDGGDDNFDEFYRRHRPWVTLATFLHPAEAHIARLRLEAAGIACVLLDELTAATHVFSIAVGGVKLQVPVVQRERAAALLGRDAPVEPSAEARGIGWAELARFVDATDAKAVACVIEAAGLECRLSLNEVPSRLARSKHIAPSPRRPWRGVRDRWLGRARVLVRREHLASAVSAVEATPFATSLASSARRAQNEHGCVCSPGACGTWTWQLVWPASSVLLSPGGDGTFLRLLRRLPRLARRCARCGAAWPGEQ